MNNNSALVSLKKALLYFFLILFALIFLAPLFWLIVSSLKTQAEMVTFPPDFLPHKYQFQNYLLALTKINYLKFLWNTIELSMIYTIPGMVTASIFGYAFARFRVRGKDFLFGIVLALLMIPPVSVLIPEYAFFAKLKLVGTYNIWLLWGIGANPLFIYLLRQFFSYFPRELEEAAIIDGSSRLGVLFRIFTTFKTCINYCLYPFLSLGLRRFHGPCNFFERTEYNSPCCHGYGLCCKKWYTACISSAFRDCYLYNSGFAYIYFRPEVLYSRFIVFQRHERIIVT